jgi:membrane fusion protein (multidrug efflux system)
LISRAFVATAALLALAACSGGKSKDARDKGPAQVGYVVVQPTSVADTTELSGRVTPYQSSEVRPQVSGILQRRLFTEGSIVHQGQPLYRIDPSLYRAAVNEAQANLLSARANVDATRAKAERYRPLAEMEAVAKQDYTDAAAAARQARASVAQSGAQLDTARINLRFTTVPAPITGRIGRSLMTEGALVTSSQADPLAVIQRLDPIFVDIQQSSGDLLALRRALSGGGVVPTTASVKLTLEDGSTYDQTGSVEFSEVVVDQTTGTVTLRARFPNPRGILLPGMFVRAAFAQAVNQRAFLVPQQALSRDPKGNASVFVVGAGNKVAQKNVTADRAVGANWVVTQGLAPGDKVITQGLGALTPGAPIRPVPANAPQKIEPPKKGMNGGQAKGA